MTDLPSDFRLAVDASARSFADGRVVVGGSPRRILRLTELGRRYARALLHGELVGAGRGRLARRLVDAGLAHPRPPARTPARQATIVIPVRDRPRQLVVALRAVAGPAVDVVVVDDGSTDTASIELACATYAATLVRLSPGRGPAGARNAALAHVSSPLVAFIDSDTEPEPGWLDILAEHFADPMIGAVAPRIRPGATVDGWLSRYVCARSPLDMGPREGLVAPGGRIRYVPTAALVVRRAAMADVAFDEELGGGEDVDFVWRLHDAGWNVRYEPRAIVRHDEPSDWRTLLRRRWSYGKSSGPLSLRHPGRVAHLVLAPLPTASAVLLLGRRWRSAVAVTAVQTVVMVRHLRAMRVPPRVAALWTVGLVGLTVRALSRVATIFAAPLVLASLVARRTRWTGMVLLLAHPLGEYVSRRPRLNPLAWLVACVADDAAYGLGVFEGCARTRTIDPLWPRRSRTEAPSADPD